jgi:hypothetical protein
MGSVWVGWTRWAGRKIGKEGVKGKKEGKHETRGKLEREN